MKPTLAVLLLLAFPRFAAAQAYMLTDLGNLDPVAINNAGQIAGGGGALWDKGKVTYLGTLVRTTHIVALNMRGQIVGTSGSGMISGMTEHNLRAFLWQNGKLTDLGTPGKPSHYEASGINDSGQIIGTSYNHPLLWENGRRTYLPKLFKDRLYEQAPCETGGINNRGQSVGYASTFWGRIHAVLWQNGHIVDLGNAGGADARAVAINDQSQIAGYVRLPGEKWIRHAFLWRNGKAPDLKTLAGDTGSQAAAINNRGQLVGTSEKIDRIPFLRGYPSRAFLWQSGKMSDLNALLPARSGWHLERAQGINDRGQIVGSGTRNGAPHGFLLTPRP